MVLTDLGECADLASDARTSAVHRGLPGFRVQHRLLVADSGDANFADLSFPVCGGSVDAVVESRLAAAAADDRGDGCGAAGRSALACGMDGPTTPAASFWGFCWLRTVNRSKGGSAGLGWGGYLLFVMVCAALYCVPNKAGAIGNAGQLGTDLVTSFWRGGADAPIDGASCGVWFSAQCCAGFFGAHLVQRVSSARHGAVRGGIPGTRTVSRWRGCCFRLLR